MNRVKFKELELDRFKAFLNSQVDHTKADVDTYLEIEGGRGCISYLQKKFMDEISGALRSLEIDNNSPMRISTGYLITNIFIFGVGWLKMTYSPNLVKQDNEKSEVSIIQGLPESCYKFKLFKIDGENKTYLTEFSTIRKLTISERFKQWLGKTKPIFTYWD